MEESQDGRSARERPAAAAARSGSVYLGKPKENKAPAGASLLRTGRGVGEHRCAASHPSNVIRAPGSAGSRSSWLGCREEGSWRWGREGCFVFTHLLRLCNSSGTELNELLCVNGNAIEREAEMLAAIHTLATDDLSCPSTRRLRISHVPIWSNS